MVEPKMSDAFDRVRNAIARVAKLDKAKVTPDARFYRDLRLDSMALDDTDVIIAVEEEFGISIPDRDAERLYTVGDLATYVEGRVSGARAPDQLGE